MKSMAFVTSTDSNYSWGARGLISSIRKFYSYSVDIFVIYTGYDDTDFQRFCFDHGVIFFESTDAVNWVMPLVYNKAKYKNNFYHSHHHYFRIQDGWPWQNDQDDLRKGFDGLSDLHPYVTKSYIVGYAVFAGYDRVVQIDCDAFLLSSIDELFETHGQPNKIVCFDDYPEALNLKIFGYESAPILVEINYSFNSGVVVFNNGDGVKELVLDYMFYANSPYHLAYAGYVDQGIIRCLVAGMHLNGEIDFVMLPGENWNPIWGKADNMVLIGDEWFNSDNGKKQFIWHGPVSSYGKLWNSRYSSECVNEAWAWVGGPVNIQCDNDNLAIHTRLIW